MSFEREIIIVKIIDEIISEVEIKVEENRTISLLSINLGVINFREDNDVSKKNASKITKKSGANQNIEYIFF